MSQQLISRSSDLAQLRADGYNIETSGAFLLVREVPYLSANRTVVRGMLVKALTLTGDVADYQNDHTIFLAGPTPHDAEGNPLQRVINSSDAQEPLPGIVIDHILSNKPQQGYRDHHELVTTYITVLGKHAHEVDPTATAQTFPTVMPDQDEDSPFVYLDTASARAGITTVNTKVTGQRVAIVGLGGTGAYILDMIAKAPVAEIHLYDGDRVMQHNAFRYPGAIPLSVLEAKPCKVDYLANHYSAMKRAVTPHPVMVDTTNVAQLFGMDFVFIAIDDNTSRAEIAHHLHRADVPFIDVGMGLYLTGGRVGGQLRTTSSLPGHREHLWDNRKRLPTQTFSAEEIYDQNIQICDLNAMNAALAVNRWKRYAGIYTDLTGEHHSIYVADGNDIINEDS